MFYGTFYEADGTVIGTESALPIRVQDLETVYDAAEPSNHDAWIWDCGVDADGNPAVVYTTFPSSLAHEYRYAAGPALPGTTTFWSGLDDMSVPIPLPRTSRAGSRCRLTTPTSFTLP